ncbi:YiiX/YebB-like N1pC/P60 family cysteine hydrolase [Listeria booriae]|uniref:YiiX/YebB-like N1pC/P60 family cysteine hydrolase n=1 Tax=Listeria booriae TaxID=1552123 RepID=UPI0021ADC26D|nr:YiiX/YebB-like N1pC/P60 family cysteine hydrolase [Listeria booriae]
MTKKNRKTTAIFAVVLASSLVLGSSPMAGSAQETDTSFESYINQLVEKQPGITKAELELEISESAKELGMDKQSLAKEALAELNDKELAAQIEAKETGQLISARGGSSGTKKLTKANQRGDVFYTPSSTLGISHGHNGIYYTTDYIVESIPKSGVRKIHYTGRNVEKNAVMQSVKTSQANRNAAANWAHSRVGDSYSYNFATNRATSTTGAKNCSKLVWSAYKLKANIDIDADKGAGVYPVDIRDSSYTVTYKKL